MRIKFSILTVNKIRFYFARPDGWLGLILGSKIFIDTTKFKFDECLEKIIKEMANVTNKSIDLNGNSMKNEGRVLTKPNAASWHKEDVGRWLKEKKIHPYLVEKLSAYDGEMIFYLHNFYLKSSEFFCDKILSESKNELSLFNLLEFTSELEKLFCSK